MDYSWNISTSVSPGVVNALTVTGLLNQTSYYFYIKTADEAGNWSPLSNRTTTYVYNAIPPAAISNLTALLPGTGLGGQITLTWTAPGNNGAGGGDANAYEVRYATKYISPPDFAASWTNIYPQSWTPATFGTEESLLLTGFAAPPPFFSFFLPDFGPRSNHFSPW